MHLLSLKPLDFVCSSFSLEAGSQENLPFFLSFPKEVWLLTKSYIA